jgi:hypothetical protein
MNQLDNIREGLAHLGSAIETIANTSAPETPPATVNSISGNAIHGGKITLLRSTGIKDLATRTSLLVEDDQITVGTADIDEIIGDLNVEGALTVGGELTAKKLRVDELISTEKRTTSMDFQPQNGSLDMVGIQWRKDGESTKQIVWKGDGFYISNDIDLHRKAKILIDDIPVLSADSLGVTIQKSSLTEVGTLINLRTEGDVNIDNFVLYDSGMMRFSIGCEAPNGQLSVASNEAEFVVDPEFDHVRIGNYTTSKLSIITDNQDRIIIGQNGGIELKGTVGINVQYPGTDVDLQVNGPVRIQDKKIGVASEIPTTGNFNKGDLLYNTNPQAGGWVGWICIEGGTPGSWKAFGAIQA